MIIEFFRSLFLIFMAELGDKTQILAMAFATQYAVGQVLLGVFIGSLLNHGVAVALGFYLAAYIPVDGLRLIAAVAFIGFGIWTLANHDDEETEQASNSFGPVITVALAFFIGELGDKTQLTAITLATQSRYPLVVLSGTVAGMILTSGMGIYVGSKLGKKIPEIAMKIAAAQVCLLFGVIGLYSQLPPEYVTTTNVGLFLALLGIVDWYMIKRFRASCQTDNRTRLRETAEKLYQSVQKVQSEIALICLGEKQCGHCQGDNCPIWLAQAVLAESLVSTDLHTPERAVPKGLSKPFNEEQGAKALAETLTACLACPTKEGNCVFGQARKALETIYLGDELEFHCDVETYLNQVEQRNPTFARKVKQYVKLK